MKDLTLEKSEDYFFDEIVDYGNEYIQKIL